MQRLWSPRARGEIPARRSGRNSRWPQPAKSPVVQSAIRRWRNPRPTAMAPAAAPVGVDGGGHLIRLA